MTALRWLTRSLADVPAGDEWLSPRERAALADLHVETRRADWRLGRWAAKEAVAAGTGAAISAVEIMPAPGGAPESLVGGRPAGVGLSISHRAGRALVVVGPPGLAIGCDLELLEPRSGAFMRTWLAPPERRSVQAAGEAGPVRLANLIWTAKEAAAKARREGLRLDVRRVVVEVEWPPAGRRQWRPLLARWDREPEGAHGWWREEPEWVYAAVSGSPTDAPRAL